MTAAAFAQAAPTRARRLRGPLLTAGSLGLAVVALQLRDPHQHGSWGLCPFKTLTGLDCPGCGGLRAVNDLGHGQWLAAAHSNLLFVASIPFLVGLWLFWTQRSLSGSTAGPPLFRVPPRALVLAATVLVLGFTILRNTPWGSGLYAA